MAQVFLGLGSNIDAESNLHHAIEALRARYGELQVSPVYSSPALGFEGDDFLNLVVGLTTDESPTKLVDFFEYLHEQAGRVRGGDKYVPRSLDIDLLLYDDVVNAELRLPRRDVLEHSFVLRPLAELAPDLAHPVTGSTMREHWNAFDAACHPLTPVDVIL